MILENLSNRQLRNRLAEALENAERTGKPAFLTLVRRLESEIERRRREQSITGDAV